MERMPYDDFSITSFIKIEVLRSSQKTVLLKCDLGVGEGIVS